MTRTNALGDTTTYNYDTNGYRTSVVDPLGGTTTFTYDAMGRVRTKTDVDGYTLTFDYDALDRLTKITFPDSSFDEFIYALLDRALMRDRAGRQTSFEYNSVRQMTKRTDPLGRVTYFQWCKCGALKTLTDPMGRTTTWLHDVQGRVKCKEYADGSKVTYVYENTTSRLAQRIDEKLQVTQYNYNRDNTLSGKRYINAAVATPAVSFTYDPNYSRITSMTDGFGTTHYGYIPITPIPTLGAGQLKSVDGPLPNGSIDYGYDALGRRVSTAINGVASSSTFDAIGRVKKVTNTLGDFNYTYDGLSERMALENYPNGQTTEYQYGSVLEDLLLQRITHRSNAIAISELIYGHKTATGQISTWSQQTGTQTPAVYSLGYDDVDQLTSARVSRNGNVVRNFLYSYDPAGNRLTEQIDAETIHISYNALNELSSSDSAAGEATTCGWDAEQRLASMTSGNRSAQLTYDGLGRCAGIRQLVGGSEVSDRRFVWCEDKIYEEHSSLGAVSKQFFDQGVQVTSGPTTGSFFYARDHLGSIRELIDSAGTVRARYDYDPFGRGTRLTGDLDLDFGFAGMFGLPDPGLNLTRFRAYDPTIARWLSRDPFPNAEEALGPNLYVYVGNDPANRVDPDGLGACEKLREEGAPRSCKELRAWVYVCCMEKTSLGYAVCALSAAFAELACERIKPPPNSCFPPIIPSCLLTPGGPTCFRPSA
jgi:RHS repeat-associated protein